MYDLDKVRRVVALKKEADNLIREIDWTEISKALCTLIFENENVKKHVSCVYITGYVPSFNDGDPCTFSSYANFRWINNIEDEDVDIEDLDEVGYSEYQDEKHFNKYYKDLLDVDFKTWMDIQKHLDDTLITDDYILENLFGSNFRLILKNDGTYSLDEYWCGY